MSQWESLVTLDFIPVKEPLGRDHCGSTRSKMQVVLLGRAKLHCIKHPARLKLAGC
jgi:hypothetical protein